MPEHETGTYFILDGDQIQFFPELPVVATLDFFQSRKMGIEFRFGRERGAIDPLEHRVALIAAPVGASRVEQFDGSDMARRGQVRATAEIDKIPLRIGRNGLSVGKTFNQLYLIVLASSFEKLNGLSLIELSPRNRKFAFCNLASAFFDLFKILRRKCPVISEVVITTV